MNMMGLFNILLNGLAIFADGKKELQTLVTSQVISPVKGAVAR
jgi:hypothetical protein